MKYFLRFLTLFVIAECFFILFRLALPSKSVIVDIICALVWSTFSLYIPKFRAWFTAPWREKNGSIRDYVPLRQYIVAMYFLPIIGMLFNIVTLLTLFNRTYYYFFHNNSLYLFGKLSKEIHKLTPFGNYWVQFEWFDDLHVCMWDEDMTISVHQANKGCIISPFNSCIQDLHRIQHIYLLLRIKREEYEKELKPESLLMAN